MNFRVKFLMTILAFSLLTLALPTVSSAQWHDRDDDEYYENNRNGRNYNRRALENTIKRLESKADDFRDDVEDALEDYDYNNRGRRNSDVQQLKYELDNFVQAAERLEDRFDGGRNLNRSRREAQDLVQSAERIGRLFNRLRLDGRTGNQWNQIRNDVRTVANAYNISFNDRNRGWNFPGLGKGGWRFPW